MLLIKIAIALPNMAYYKFRIKFLLTGEISGKYTFHSKKGWIDTSGLQLTIIT